jgi:hypothetical protein
MLFFHTAGERKNDKSLQAYKRLLDTSCRLCQPDQTRPDQERQDQIRLKSLTVSELITDLNAGDPTSSATPWTVKFVSFMFKP